MSDIPLPPRPADSAKKQDWVNYLAAHGVPVEEARRFTKAQMLSWKPPVQKVDTSEQKLRDYVQGMSDVDPRGAIGEGHREPPPVKATMQITHPIPQNYRRGGVAGPDVIICYPQPMTEAVLDAPESVLTAEEWMDQHGFKRAEQQGNTLNIQDAILECMKLVGHIGKNSRNTQGTGYNFRGVDAVVNAVAPAFQMFGVTISPELRSCTTRLATDVGNNNGTFQWADVIVAYTLRARDGSSVQWVAPGAAMDSGDKAIGKAMSVAYRIAMLQGLCIPTDEPDPDSVTYGHDDPDAGRTYGRGQNARQEQPQRQQSRSRDERPDYTDQRQGPQPSQADRVRAYTLEVMSQFDDWDGSMIREAWKHMFPDAPEYMQVTDVEQLKAFGRQIREDATADRARAEQEAVDNVMNGLGGNVIDGDGDDQSAG